ncbi:MAG: hypothetical protein HUJ11_05315, partial [Arenibacter algicola]|nr:hypothetical protein [Arenibacter algicola]
GGTLRARVFAYKGIHPDAIAVPMGRGHTHYGRYAENGVNPLAVLDAPQGDRQASSLLGEPTPATVTATGDSRYLVRLMDTDRQHGRKLVATIPAQQHRRNTGGA